MRQIFFRNWLVMIMILLMVNLTLLTFPFNIYLSSLSIRYILQGVLIVSIVLVLWLIVKIYSSYFQSFIESNNSVTLGINRNLKIIFHNQKTIAFFKEAHLFDSQHIFNLIPKGYWEEWGEAIRSAFQGKQTRLINTLHDLAYYIDFWPVTHKNKIKLLVISINRVENTLQKISTAEENAFMGEIFTLKNELLEQEANFSALINNTKDMMVSVDFKYKILSANRAFIDFCNQMGFEAKKGSNYLRVVSEQTIQKRKKYIDKALEGFHFTIIEEWENSQGETMFIEISYNPIPGDDPSLTVGVAMFARNITALKEEEKENQLLIEKLEQGTKILKEKEESLQASLIELRAMQKQLLEKNEELLSKEALMRSIIDNAQDGIMAIGKYYDIILISQSLKQRYLELGAVLEVGYNLFTVIPPEQIPHWKNACDRSLHGEHVHTMDKIGNRFYDVSISPIYNNHNLIIGATLLIRDMSKQIHTINKSISSVDLLRKIQEKSLASSSEKEKEIEVYRNKLEDLKKEANRLKDL